MKKQNFQKELKNQNKCKGRKTNQKPKTKKLLKIIIILIIKN